VTIECLGCSAWRRVVRTDVACEHRPRCGLYPRTRPAAQAAVLTRRVRAIPLWLVMNAASMTRPLTVVLDSFAARTGTRYQIEPGASLEIAGESRELGRPIRCDCDGRPDVFPKLLMPRYTTWYACLAATASVLRVYTDTSASRGRSRRRIGETSFQRSGVQVGSAPTPTPTHRDTARCSRFQLAERPLSPTRARRGTVGRGAAAQRATT